MQVGGFGWLSGGVKRQAQVIGPLDGAIASKLIRRSTGRVDTGTL